MTASLRGLAACTALAVLLALGWVLGLGAAELPPSPHLWARRPDSVQSIRWLRDGRPRMAAQRDGAGWSATPAGAARPLPAKARVLDDLLDVLAGASWHRRAPVARAGAVRELVVVTSAGGEQSIGLGQALGEQRWIVLGDRALLVDGWVTRVLEKAPEELLDLAPLPDAARATVLEIHRSGAAPWKSDALVLQGGARVSPSRARLDEAVVRALGERLGALAFAPELAAAAAADEAGEAGAEAGALWSLRLAGGPSGEATLVGLGPCAGGGARVVSSRLGGGCLRAQELSALAELIDRAASPAAVDARPLAAALDEVEEWTVTTRASPPETYALVRRGHQWSAGAGQVDVEAAAVEQVLAVLTSPWGLSEGLPSSPPISSLTARRRDGATVSLSVYGGPRPVVVRDGEPRSLTAPVPLELAPRQLARAFASLTVWALEPTDIARVRLGGEELKRGAVIGEWWAGGALIAPARAAALEELLAQLSAVRLLERRPALDGTAPSARLRCLTLWLAPSPSSRAAPSTPEGEPHTIELDASPSRRECVGRADGRGGLFAPELCAQLAALVP